MSEFPYSNAFAYVSQLASQLRRERIYDTDYALSQDAEWFSKMRKDAIASFLVRFRSQLVAGTNWGCEGSTESPQDKRAASVMESLLEQVDNFKQARELLSLAFLRGTTWGRLGGKFLEIDTQSYGVRRFWVVTQIRDVDKRRFDYRKVCSDPIRHQWFFSGSEFGTPSSWTPVDARHWIRHQYNADEASLGWGRGLAEAMYFLMMFKADALQRGMAFLERWAGGMLVATIDQLQIGALDATSASRLSAILNILDQMRSQHVAAIGSGDEIKMIEGSTLGWNTVQGAVDYCDNALSRLILGAVLPTGGASDKGSMARAAVESDSTAALVASDRELLADSITKSLVKLLWEANWPLLQSLGLGPANMPKFVIRHVEEHDPGERATTAKTLIDAGLGRFIKPSEVIEQAGFSMAGPGEAVIGDPPQKEAPGQPPAAAPPKQPRQPQGLPDMNGIAGAMDIAPPPLPMTGGF